ncbi:FxsA family protein [Methylomagnum sp.]
MNMGRWLLLAVLSLPVVEIYLLIKLMGALGFFLTLTLLLGAAALGMFLLRTQGFSTMTRVQQAMARGEVPAREMIESGLVALGGLLLLIPGFLSDIFALFCLVPVTRQRLALRILRDYVGLRPATGEPSQDRLTIEGEFKREE